MERVALILEESGQRLGCLLNPGSLDMWRRAGVRSRRSIGGIVTGSSRADDPLLYTGGGWTELQLDLLFDTSLAGSTIKTDDVRDLTGPLWNLTENRVSGDDGYGSPPLVRFVWGKSWNIPGVILAVAERLEQFSSSGAPRRSWLRMRMRRVAEPTRREQPPPRSIEGLALPTGDEEIPVDQVRVHQVVGASNAAPAASGGGDDERLTSERLDQLAHRYYKNSRFWRLIAAFNKVVDPLSSLAGRTLRLPPRSLLDGPGTQERA